jgi:hypothetical protein
MPPGRCLSLQGPPEHAQLRRGRGSRAIVPSRRRSARVDASWGVEGTRIAGRRATVADVADWPAFAVGITTSTPRMKTTAATTVDGGARRTWSCARFSGNHGHRVGMKEGGGRRVAGRRRRRRRSASLTHWCRRLTGRNEREVGERCEWVRVRVTDVLVGRISAVGSHPTCQLQCGIKMGLGGCFGLNLRVGCGSGFRRPIILKDFSVFSVQLMLLSLFLMFLHCFIQKYDCIKYD